MLGGWERCVRRAYGQINLGTGAVMPSEKQVECMWSMSASTSCERVHIF